MREWEQSGERVYQTEASSSMSAENFDCAIEIRQNYKKKHFLLAHFPDIGYNYSV